MQINSFKSVLTRAVRLATVLLFGVGTAIAQQQVNLTAAPSTATMPDGSMVPMWGYSCGVVVSGSTATCGKSNPPAIGWSPVVITVPTGQGLTINLTNSLSFANGNSVPTSLTIVGQLGGGLGTTATSTASPNHSSAQTNNTWPIAGASSTPGTPPSQANRVKSFSTEVAINTTTALTWTAANLNPGTYLIESGTHPSIQGSIGLYGILVVTTAPTGATPGTAYPGVTYGAEVPLLFSEIDPVQNNAVNTAVNTVGFSETMVWSGQSGGCGNKTSSTYNQCYPPVVNYTPLYYMINGVAFNKTNAKNSLFPASLGTAATPVTGGVLVRLVNAGLRMHVPAIAGSTTKAGAAGGFSLIAEDGNPLPGLPRVQNEVFMAAGKTYDVMVDAPQPTPPVSPATVPTPPPALVVYDRELSLSGNATARDAGMLAYIGVNGGGTPSVPAFTPAIANPDTYNSLVSGQTFTVSDPAKGVIANDINVMGVTLVGAATGGTVSLNANGTFTFVPTGSGTSGSFTYEANGNPAITATVTLGAATIEAASGIAMNPITYTSNVATYLKIASPGILSVDKDTAGYPLTVDSTTVVPATGLTVAVDASGGFNASVSGPGTYTFTYKAKNSQGTQSTSAATVTLIFPTPTNLAVTVLDGHDKTTPITDYRWIIEEDRTFYVDPNCTTNPPPAGCPTAGGIVQTFGTNFHTSYMPVVATGCTGSVSCESGQKLLSQSAVCDMGNGICRTTGTEEAATPISQVHLDPTKRYYLSVLPGDAANPFEAGNLTGSCLAGGASAACGHGMGGAPIAVGQSAVTVFAQPTPFPPAKLSVFVFEDDFPLNGEQDAGGGVDALSPNEPGLGQFNITVFDDAGGSGDATGQANYDMFNQPLSNSLDGYIDPATGNNACPITKQASGIIGQIVTCPKYELAQNGAATTILSPLAGSAVVANMYPGRYGIVATPGADRIARGEEWLQTNTLDGQKAHDSFLRIGEAGYFQEFGPAGYHVSIGFANPKIINGRMAPLCNGTDPNSPLTTPPPCNNTVTGMVTTERMSRTPDERLYSSGSNDSFSFTQCYVSIGDPDGEDFAFTKCASDGTFSISGLPDGDWRVTVFDQWNDMLVDGLSTPVRLAAGTTAATTNLGQIAINQWQANIYTKTFLDLNGDGVKQDAEPGLSLVPTNVRYRDGSFSNFNNTDLSGNAGFNEEFPLFNWYVVETDATRYKNTGTHVVYDAGGPADGTNGTGGWDSTIGHFLANTAEAAAVALPAALRVPGAVYCDTADCTGLSIANGPGTSKTGSTGRIDPPWVLTEGWQGFSGQNSFLEFGKKPYADKENGGIRGHVIYASTRPFDDPRLLLQTSWEPLVPNVTINLYQEGTAADGSQTLALVDTTKTSSFDDWAQGFRTDGVPFMNCPGQLPAPTGTTPGDVFFFTLQNQPEWLDVYNNGGTPAHTVPNNSQFKCYDGMHNWNQLQPAPYDGMYQFPSVIGLNPTTGKPTGTNCTACIPNPDASDPYRSGLPMLPAGKYVVEVVVPPGYELVKEEDKNILIGDNYIAPVTVQFPGLGGSIFILPDQAAVSDTYNSTNGQNSTQDLGRTTLPSTEADTGSIEQYWPCVGASRIVPDYISLFPQSKEVSPFAGATRNLCDRKEVTLVNQAAALAKFYLFTSTHAAAHFAGVVTDDFTSEFDPFSPQFGEKFAPPDLPISIKDWTGTEVSRVYTDQWGAYNGLTYSTWEVNPPNPTGYAPQMMVTCMNDPGTGATPDPLFNPAYSQFCYEIPFMPGQTQYMDTPVTPTSAFSDGYNHVDCAYPDATPAIAEVDGDGLGPWVSAPNVTLTIHSLGNQPVINNGYSGPSATAAPFNAKTITRHYGFGTQCTSPGTTDPTCSTLSSVTIGGVPANITSWSDTTITVAAPSNVPLCGIQQQAQYGGPGAAGVSTARCGQLVITAGNGKQSIDTVTVTVGGKKPTHVAPSGSIQAAIDAASPGDMIIVDPTATTATVAGVTTTTYSQANHYEMLLMWKPLRLQGVGAATSILNASPHPEGKLDPWRRQVNCLFGLSLKGTAISGTNPYDSTSTFTCTSAMQFQVDRLPLEAVVGWDATLNGNLAELLQEPTLMGAYEGAAITVLSKGVNFPSGPASAFASDTFPADATLLTASNCGGGGANPFPGNFWCNPSSIDGLGITDSSQGGGGIFVHAWGHNLQIANNRIYNNTGTLSGGISVGQGEFPPAYLQGSATNATPGSCQTSTIANTELPYCHNVNVNVHNNAVMLNSSIGDELFSATLAGVGGVSFCTGADYYKFNYNWVCGNVGSGDGGGVGQIGFAYNGDIEHNSILFNQSTNPTISTNGGGLLIMGAPDTDPVCAGGADADCPVGLSDGTGPGLVINANLIQGNAAESGSGGGLRLQNINGTEITSFPTTPSNWYTVSVTNNIISNNVAGWDGGGVSLQDALAVNFVNNTVMSNDSTASAGPLFNTLGAPLASAGGPPITGQQTTTGSAPQPAGLVSIQNSAPLTTALNGLATITCPAHNLNCKTASNPYLANDIFWQNRSFYIGVGSFGPGVLNQQNVVTLYNAFTTTRAASQTGTGACPTASYWDIGVRGDTGPANHSSTLTLAPTYSLLTDAADYPGLNNLGANPTAVSQYCNGSRTPPENTQGTFQVPPGISDATVPNPIFNLTPAATVDEGNNWINISWGPLSLSNSITGATLGNYALALGSQAIDYIPTSSPTFAVTPSTDFYGKPRPDAGLNNRFDIGAVEFQGSGLGTLAFITPNTGAQGTVVPVTITGTLLAGATSINGAGTGITVSNFVAVNATTVTATFTILATAPPTARNITVTTPAGNTNAGTFTVVAAGTPTLISVAPGSGLRGLAVPVTLTGTNFTAGTTVAIAAPANGLTVSGVTVVNPTTITATFTTTTAATLGTRLISVVTGAVTSGTVPYTVTGPVLTAINPISRARSTSGTVTLTGTGLTGTTAVNVSGAGITVSAVTVVNDTAVTANFAIAANASGTARNVTVTSLAGTSNAVTFTVTVPPGALTSIAPNTGARGTSETVTFTGTSLTGTTAANVSGGGITPSAITVVDDSHVTATFTMTATATLTARNVTLTTPAGVTNAVTFTVVTPGTPILTSITPSSGLRSFAIPVVLAGSNFTTGSTVAVAAPAGGFTVSGVTVVSPTQINATFTTTGTATLGPRNISVVTPGGASGTVQYTVLGPALTSIAPVSGNRGSIVPVTLTGTGLTGTTAITVPGGGITVGPLSVTGDTTVAANLTITAGAALTARNITVTAPGGVSNPVTFTVTAPPVPALTSITPATGVRGTAVPVSLAGTNLAGATAITVSGTGVTVSGLTSTATTATATFTITAGATLSARTVSVTTAGGTSNTVPFTVQGATLTSMTPVTGVRGTAVPVTFTGSNLTGATALTGLGTGVTATGITVVSSTQVTATLNLAPGATLGIRNIGVTTPIGNTNTVPFTVTGATVTFAGPTPSLLTGTTATSTGSVTVSNAAAATGSLALTAAPTVVKVGTAGGTFSIAAGGTCTSTTVLAPGASCTITVQYVPAGTATATAHVTLTGTGLAAATLSSANFTAN